MKRYDHYPAYDATGNHTQVNAGGMEESKDGEFVKWEDVEELFEATEPAYQPDKGLAKAKTIAFLEKKITHFDFDTKPLVDSTTGEVLYTCP